MKTIIILFIFSSLSTFGSEIVSSIIDIDEERIYLLSGDVIKAKSKLLREQLLPYLINHNDLYFHINQKNELIRFNKLGDELEFDQEDLKQKGEDIPSILNRNQVEHLFSTLRTGAKRFSQCFNRAHIWAYESKIDFNINTIKVFLFFTKKFIREYDFKWWFHVAPGTYLIEKGTTTLTMLDPYFASTPQILQEWIHLFVPRKLNCREIQKYSEYEKEQSYEYCFTLNVPMYYLQPKDLKKLEEEEQIKNMWLNTELKRPTEMALEYLNLILEA